MSIDGPALIQPFCSLPMTILFDRNVIHGFFGTISQPEGDAGRDIFCFAYTASRLNYNLLLNSGDETVSLGCSFEEPFGADSLFEITVPCDLIREIPDGYYAEKTGLGFWYGNSQDKQNCTLQLLKRPDGHLKVWPGCYYPKRHKLHSEIWSDEKPSSANEPED